MLLSIILATTALALLKILHSRKRRAARAKQVEITMRELRERRLEKPTEERSIVGMSTIENQRQANVGGMTVFTNSKLHRNTSYHDYLLRPSPNTNAQHFIGGTYHIDYKDDSGHITSRSITIKNIYRKNYTTYVKAHCHLRNEERTFVLQRIINYITDANTGELHDPDELSPLKNKIVIPAATDKYASHIEISKHDSSWFLHHPRSLVSRKEEREKLCLTAYAYQIDAYRAAVAEAVAEGADTLYLYIYGKYKPSRQQKLANKINVIQIDISTPNGLAKKTRLSSV
jgi:hypothetical protein